MEHKIRDTALLVFSLSAKKEADRKALFGSGKRTATRDFFNILIKQTADIALTSGVDVVWIDEKKQRGTSFGERYANAFQELFDQGYKKVVSIGNDCPHLTAAILKTAIDQLKQNRIVLGPSTDGGIYLIGINKSYFNKTSFCGLPWLQDTLFGNLMENVALEQEQVFLLKPLSDIDTKKDVFAFALGNSFSELSRFILNHLSKSSYTFSWEMALFIPASLPNAHTLRGPPGL